jgi:hypothetical protein
VIIKRTSPFSGKEHVMDINVTEKQLMRWRAGEKIQDAMSNLTADEREFIMTGITPSEWKETFRDDY